MLPPDHLLSQISETLRHRVGPAVGDEFARTQAYMAAVVLQKLSRQLALADEHASADVADRRALHAELAGMLDPADPPDIVAVVGALPAGDDALGPLVETLHRRRDVLGDERCERLLARVRATLRSRLDRRLEYAA